VLRAFVLGIKVTLRNGPIRELIDERSATHSR
jgi:hypothetical protein